MRTPGLVATQVLDRDDPGCPSEPTLAEQARRRVAEGKASDPGLEALLRHHGCMFDGFALDDRERERIDRVLHTNRPVPPVPMRQRDRNDIAAEARRAAIVAQGPRAEEGEATAKAVALPSEERRDEAKPAPEARREEARPAPAKRPRRRIAHLAQPPEDEGVSAIDPYAGMAAFFASRQEEEDSLLALARDAVEAEADPDFLALFATLVGGQTSRARTIMRIIAGTRNVLLADMVGPSRALPLIHPRQEATYWVARCTPLSFPVIGRLFGGRDHTTVLHSIRKHAERKGLPPAREGRL